MQKCDWRWRAVFGPSAFFIPGYRQFYLFIFFLIFPNLELLNVLSKTIIKWHEIKFLTVLLPPSSPSFLRFLFTWRICFFFVISKLSYFPNPANWACPGSCSVQSFIRLRKCPDDSLSVPPSSQTVRCLGRTASAVGRLPWHRWTLLHLHMHFVVRHRVGILSLPWKNYHNVLNSTTLLIINLRKTITLFTFYFENEKFC